jgi:hypothetical protein
MLTPLPKDSGDTFEALTLKGVLGVPNSCIVCAALLKAEPGAGDDGMMICAFLEGVSGI